MLISPPKIISEEFINFTTECKFQMADEEVKELSQRSDVYNNYLI